MKFKNKKCLVYGLGESGRSAIKLLNLLGAHVFFYDEDMKYINQIGYVKNLEKEKFDYCVVSPGVKIIGNEKFEILKKNKTKILSELDLGYVFIKGKIIAVTGTNGKTTTCMLIYKILKEAGKEVYLCGNIGLPITNLYGKTNKDSFIVCEVSSFQLESSEIFKCEVGAILNIKPDHLDRHGSMEEYINVKSKLLKMSHVNVLNLDDENAKKLINNKKCVYFTKNLIKKGVFIKNNCIFYNKTKIFDLSKLNLLGEKNLENVLASVACLSQYKIPICAYDKAISSFKPASHRMEKVGEHRGITFIDDSKATNVASTINALSAFKNKNIILLLGGQGKGYPYDEIFKYDIKEVVTFGEEGKVIFECAKKYNKVGQNFSTFEDACIFTMHEAKIGDVVLLSPACSSFDEFSSYAERGEKFKEIVLRFISEQN